MWRNRIVKKMKNKKTFYYHFLYEWILSTIILIVTLLLLRKFDIHIVIVFSIIHGIWLWYLHWTVKKENNK